MSSTPDHVHARSVPACAIFPARLVLACLLASAGRTSAQVATHEPSQVVQLETFVVTPSRFQLSADSDGSSTALTQEDLQALPQVGEDVFRSIGRLPGVTADDFSAKFTVRGAPQRQVLVRLDGAELLEPFHLKDLDGALSVIDLVNIQRLDLMTGGFNVDFGNRAGAVLTMETRSPTGTKPVTSAGLSVTSMRAGTAGTFAGQRGRWLASVRRGYPDLTLKLTGRSQRIHPEYWDAYGKVEYDLSLQHTLSLHLLHARDTMQVDDPNGPDLASSYDSDYVWARWRASWSPALESDTVLSQSALAWRRDGFGEYTPQHRLAVRDRRSLHQTQLRQRWLYRADDLLLRFGGNLTRSDADYAYRLSREISFGGTPTMTRITDVATAPAGASGGAFFAARFSPFTDIAIEPGLRFDANDAAGDNDLSPRLNASWDVTRRSTLRAAWGQFTQAQGWHELQAQFGETSFQPSEKAEHRVLSFEHRVTRGTLVRVEAYERITRDPRAYWFSRFDSYDIFPEARGDRIRLAPQRANARGLEFIAQSRSRGHLEWSVSYALSKSVEEINGRTMPTARDQRHAAHIDATYRLGEYWRLGAAFHYHTGWPITPVIWSVATTPSGVSYIQRNFGPTLSERLPDYHRLDLRVSRRVPTKYGEFNVFVDVFNAYDRANPIAYDYNPRIVNGTMNDGRKTRSMLPLLPSVGISWER